MPVDAGAVQLVVESRQLTNQILAGHVRRGRWRWTTHVHFDDFGASLHVCGPDGLGAPAVRLLRERAALPLHRAGRAGEHGGPHRRAGRRRPDRVLAAVRVRAPRRHAPPHRCGRPRRRRGARPGGGGAGGRRGASLMARAGPCPPECPPPISYHWGGSGCSFTSTMRSGVWSTVPAFTSVLVRAICAYHRPLSRTVRRCVVWSTCTRPNRLPYPHAHSKLSSSDHTK